MDYGLETLGSGLFGGILLGASTSLLLALEGWNEGVCGMVAGLWRGASRERWFRALFLFGLAGAGGLYWLASPTAFADASGRPVLIFAAAGWFVGYGARLANGCTSGHGVLGVSRGSLRSFVAISLFGISAFTVQLFYPASLEPARVSHLAQDHALCSDATPCTAQKPRGVP